MRLRTSANFSYVMGSHVMQFGTLALQRERVGDYEGTKNTGETRVQGFTSLRHAVGLPLSDHMAIIPFLQVLFPLLPHLVPTEQRLLQILTGGRGRTVVITQSANVMLTSNRCALPTHTRQTLRRKPKRK